MEILPAWMRKAADEGAVCLCQSVDVYWRYAFLLESAEEVCGWSCTGDDGFDLVWKGPREWIVYDTNLDSELALMPDGGGVEGQPGRSGRHSSALRRIEENVSR